MAVNQGEVDIVLDDTIATLRCSLVAAKTVNATFGDFITASRRLENFDFDAYAPVVAAGLGKKVKEVDEAVFKTGMHALLPKLLEYVVLLSHGGQMPKAAGTAEGAPKGED